jgi:hypothetical protein
LGRLDVGFRGGDDDNRAHDSLAVDCNNAYEDGSEYPGSLEWVEIIDVKNIDATDNIRALCDEVAQFSD